MNPTPEQVEQCRLAEADMIELVGKLIHEGMDVRVILGAISTVTTSMLLQLGGNEAPSIWFARQSAMTMHLARPA